ncbi:MAG: hypothetical protein RJB01_388 [Actinomycetota bacterium]
MAPYASADDRRGALQIVTTIALLIVGLISMYLLLPVSYGAVLLVAIPTSLLQVRLFILFHDLAHGSLLSSRRITDVLGDLLGVMCYTPYRQWRRRHLIHHATSGNLDRRGWWEIPTVSVAEYQAMSPSAAITYRVLRSPSFLFTIGAFLFFIVVQRFPVPNEHRRERLSLWGTNIALLAIAVVVIASIGWQAALAVWLPFALISSAIGMWLFYVQHQFEDAYWHTADSWSFYDAAMRGSSLLTMPRILSWFFTGIGVHHIHHLNPRIPNYKLLDAHTDNAEFHTVTELTLRSSLQCLRANLWDGSRMISFREARTLPSTDLRSAALRS